MVESDNRTANYVAAGASIVAYLTTLTLAVKAWSEERYFSAGLEGVISVVALAGGVYFISRTRQNTRDR